MQLIFRCCLLVVLFASGQTIAYLKDSYNDVFFFEKALVSQVSAFNSPTSIFKSKKGDVWLFFDKSLNIIFGNNKREYSYSQLSAYTNKASFDTHITENSNGIFFSVGNELFHYSENDRIIKRLPLELSENDQIVFLKSDSNQIVWVVSYLAVYKIQTPFEATPFIFPDKFIDGDVGSPLPYTAAFDSQNNLFLSTYSFGLLQIDEKFRASQLSKVVQGLDTAQSMVVMNDQLLIASGNRLFAWDEKSGRLNEIFKADERIEKIIVDRESVLFFSKSRIWRLTPPTSQIKQIKVLTKTPLSSDDITIRELYVDNENILWLSIKDEGLFSFHPSRNIVKKVDFEIGEAKNSNLFDFTDTEDFVLSNRNSTYISKLDIKLSFPSYSLLKTDDRYVFGSNGQMVSVMPDKSTASFDLSKNSFYTDDKVINIVESPNKHFWTVSEKTGLKNFLEVSKSYQPIDISAYIPLDVIVNVRFVMPYNAQSILFVTEDEFYEFNYNTKRLSLLISLKNEKLKLAKITRDNNTLNLITTNDKLYTYDLKRNQLTRLNVNVTNVGCFVKHKNSWLIAQTKGKLFQWRKGKLSSFNEQDGLPIGGLNGKECKNIKGSSYFSGFDGIYTFEPLAIKKNSVKPSLRIDVIEYANKKISPKKSNSEISIKAQDLPIKFQLASSSYLKKTRNQYQYRLQNKENIWRDISNVTSYVIFDELAPGDYIFQFRSSNNDSLWSEPVNFVLNVKPPWWFSDSAKVIFVLVLFLIIYSINNYRTIRIKQRASELEVEVTKRTDALKVEKDKVEKLLSQKNQELANLSHEFKTPLTLILGPLNQVLGSKQEEKNLTRLNIAQRNALRLLRMVDQLLNLETFRVKAIAHKSSQPIGKITQLLSDAFADLAKEKGIEFSSPDNFDLNFEFTPDAFDKILINLLSNAIKYTKPGGTIALTCKRLNGMLELTVTDTGIGIPKLEQTAVFKRYHRVVNTSSEAITGAGIGLSLVKELVEHHNGKIQLESELGVGTKITVCLPILHEVNDTNFTIESNSELIKQEFKDAGERTHGDLLINQSFQNEDKSLPTVLVIEDNDDMRRYITECLVNNYRVLTARDGKEGIAIASSEVPDLVVSDIMMPQLDGFQTIQRLRSNPVTNHIPIVLLTARGDRDSRLRGWQEKADEYLTKPFDPEELNLRLANLLDIRNILKKYFAEHLFKQTKPASNANEDISEDLDINKRDQQHSFIEKLNESLELLHGNTNLSMDELAQSLHMSRRQLFRKIKSVLDMTPAEYLRRFRLEKAKELLSLGKSSSFVAFEVGFSTQSHFSQCFKAQFNVSPKDFKAE